MLIVAQCYGGVATLIFVLCLVGYFAEIRARNEKLLGPMLAFIGFSIGWLPVVCLLAVTGEWRKLPPRIRRFKRHPKTRTER